MWAGDDNVIIGVFPFDCLLAAATAAAAAASALKAVTRCSFNVCVVVSSIDVYRPRYNMQAHVTALRYSIRECYRSEAQHMSRVTALRYVTRAGLTDLRYRVQSGLTSTACWPV